MRRKSTIWLSDHRRIENLVLASLEHLGRANVYDISDDLAKCRNLDPAAPRVGFDTVTRDAVNRLLKKKLIFEAGTIHYSANFWEMTYRLPTILEKIAAL